MKTIFLDTSVLLEFKPVAEIPWPKLAGSPDVLLVLAPVVIRELNGVKDSPKYSRKKRYRAASRLAWINQVARQARRVDNGLEAELTLKARLLLLDHDPTIDFSRHRLNESLGDDWLIASIIFYQGDRPADEVALATADVGVRLKATAHHLAVLDLPDDTRLPEEPDELEQRNAQLEEEITLLRHRVPKLRLCFADGENRAYFGPQKAKVEPRDPGAMLDAVRGEHPQIAPSVRRVPGRPELAGIGLVGAWAGLIGPSAEDAAAYNEQLAEYYRDYYEYAIALAAYQGQVPLNLEIRIANEGTCPAENVRVLMHFPDGFLVCSEDDFPQPPEEPRPPTKPGSGIDTGLGFRVPLLAPSSSILADVAGKLAPPGNVSRARIRHAGSYDVELSVRSLQHHDGAELPDLYAVFDRAEAVASFHIQYRLIADNTPTPQEGQLYVVCETNPPAVET